MFKIVGVIAVFLASLLAQEASALIPIGVTASDWQEPNRPINTIDESWNTRWSCQGTCWIQYDFGSVRHLDTVEIYWRNSDTRVETFDVEVSTDGSTWELVFSGDSELDTHAPDEAPIPSVVEVGDDMRYVRITGYGNSFNDWNSLERIFFLPPGEEGFPYHPQVVAITSSSVIDGNTPDRAFDESFKTFWTGGLGDYIEFEMEDVVPLNMVSIAWMNGHLRKQNYAIDVSVDGDSWERIVEATSTGKSLDFEANQLSDYPLAKYVRIYGFGNDGRRASSRPKISITEVEFVAAFFDESEITGIAGR